MIYKHLTIFYIRENITIGNDATFIINDINIDVLGSVTIEAGGTLNISKSELTFSTTGKYIDNSGSLIIEGVSGNNSIITANNITNRFYINNNAGSSLLMKYYEIDYLTGNGIFVASGSTIDEIADNFSFGVFGANCNSTQCVDVSGVNFATHDTITVNGIIFENAGTNNISRTSGTGVLNFIDASGSKAGSSFENDNGNPGTLINWTYPSSTYYTVASGNFSDPAIWNVNPSLHFSDASAVFHIKDEHNVVLDIDIDVLELLIGDSLSGTLAIGNDATIRTITVRENLTVNANASLSVGSSAIHIVEMYGNISNNGSINLRVSGANVANVNFYGQNSAVLGIGTVNFNTVTFKTGTVTTAYTMFNVLQNVVIEDNAEFNDGDLTHTIARNWTETGTGRRSGDGKIIFSGTVNTISSTDNTVVEFYDVECTSAGVSVFASMSSSFSTNILGSFEVTNTREIQLVDNPMSVSGNFIVETGATFSVTGANTTVAFVGVNNQTIDLSGTVAFSNVDFDGASTKTVLGNMNIARRLTIQDGATVDGAGNHTIENGIYIHGICNFTGNLIAKGGTISSDKEIIELAHLSNLIIDGVVNITASSTLELRIFGNLDVIANYLVINSDVFIVNTGIGTFSIDDNLWMYVRSEDGFPKNFDNYNISETSNIRYDMTTSTQIIRGGVEYGNLRLRNTNKIADADIVVKGGFVIETANIEVDMAGYNLNVSGNISTNNTSTINMSVGGTLTLDAEDNNQTMGAGIYRLTNLEFTLDAPSATRSKYISVGSHIELSGDFTATCGSAGSYYLDIYFYDNEINGIAQNMTVAQNSRIRTTSIDFGDAVFSKFSGVIDLLSGTVVYDNTATTQLIANNVVYGNIAFAGTQIKEAKGNLSIKGDVSVLGNIPYFKSAGYTHSIAGNLMLGTANTRFADLNINDKIIFDGIDQIIYPSNFQHLEIANSGIDSVSGVAGNLTISGDFTVKNNAKFASKSRNMIVHGDFTIEPSGEFTQESNGTVTFEGVASNQSITLNPNSYTSTFTNNGNVQFNGAGFAYTINNSNKTFYNISFDGYSSYLLEANLNVRNDFTIYDNATVDAYVNNRTIAVSGNWNNTGNFIARNSTITFNAISANKTIDNGNSNFHNITIDVSNSEYTIINNNLKTSGNFTIINGKFNQNGFAHFFGDGVGTDYLSVTDNGIYSIGASSELRMANNSNVSISNGGLFNALGTNNFSRAVIRNQSTGSYSFEVEALGKFAAQYYHFQNMNGMGINIKTGAILDSVNNLSNGIFSNGQTGGTFLTLNNELPNHPSDEIIDNVVFNSGPTYNVTRHTGGTIVDFKDASGLLGTFDSENDIVMPADPASGLIIWSELNNAYWTGAAGDNNWHNTANWLGGVVPSILQNVTIGSTSFNPIISNDSAYARRLFIHQDATLSIDNQPLTVAEEIWIDGNLSANNNAEIFVSGNWINNGGSFVCGNSSVILNSVASENILVTNDSEFYNLEINSQGEYNADNNIRTLNNLTLSDGILNPGNFDTYVGGSWINDGGVFVAGNNTVYLQGNTNNILRAGASPFYNIVNNNTTGISLDGNLILTNNFTQAAGQLNLSPDAGTNSYNLFAKNMEIDGGNINAYDAVITVSNSWIASGTGSFTPGTSTVVMTSNSLTREITSNGSPFYNLQIEGTSSFNLTHSTTIEGDLFINNGRLSIPNGAISIEILGNWNNNGQFAPGNGNVTFAGIQAQSISGSANHTFCGLEINNMSAEGIVLNRPVRINCMLNLTNGVIHSTNVNMLIFNPGSASEIGNENAFVSGPIKKIGDTDFIFPTGRDTIWAPIGITAPSVISDEFVAEYFFEANENAESPCTNCALGVRRVSTVEYWDISPTNGNSTPDVTLYFKDMARSVITDVNDLCFAHWNGSVWERMGTFHGFMDGPNSCYVTGTDFISFSPVTAGSENGANALPIELIEFNAIVNNSDVVLKWTTASETNNHYFTIERYLDGINFQEISIVQGKGNSSVKTNYVTIDKDLMAGQYYYRLKQTDFDGQYSYSHIISALVIIESKLNFEIWPIPSTKDVVSIVFSHNSNLPVNISISDVTSKIVFEKEYETFNNYLQLNLAKEYSFKTGVYYITVSTKENTITKQIVVIE